MKKVHPLIITAVGTVLALAVALINYFAPFAEQSAAFTAWLVLSPVWAFCVAPSYAFAVWKFYKSTENDTFESGLRKGAWAGLTFGFDIILLPVLIAPVFAIMYYVTLFKKDNKR